MFFGLCHGSFIENQDYLWHEPFFTSRGFDLTNWKILHTLNPCIAPKQKITV